MKASCSTGSVRTAFPTQFLRELTQNAIEATLELPEKRGEIVWDVDWNRQTLTGIYKLTAIDTGIGMTGEEMLEYINKLSSSMRQQSVTGNYGVGAKIAAAPRNHAGMLYLSWKDVNVHTHLPQARSRRGRLRAAAVRGPVLGSGTYWGLRRGRQRPQQNAIKIGACLVLFLCNSDEQDTMKMPGGRKHSV